MNQWQDSDDPVQAPKRKRDATDAPDAREALRQVEDQLAAHGIDLNLDGSVGVFPRRRRRGCGCLTGISVVLFVVTLVIAIGGMLALMLSPDVARTATPLFCPSGTNLVQVEGARTYDGTEIWFHCVDVEGELILDATGNVVVGLIGLFVLPFVTGILMALTLTVGAVRGTARMVNQVGSAAVRMQTSPGVNVTYQTVDLRDRPQDERMQAAAQIMNQFFEQGISAGSAAGSGGKGDVTDRLRELKEAYESNLITIEEYNRKREEILREL